MAFSYDSRPIQTIINQIKNISKRDGIDLQPPYQRGFIWSTEFKDKLLFSISKGYPIGSISLRIRADKNSKGAMQEIVDGQQRLTTIFNFITGDYDVQGEYARKMIEHISEYLINERDMKLEKLKKKLKNRGTISIKFSQLPDTICENFHAFNLSITNISNSTDEEIAEYFRYLQNQERLRAGEIIKSMPDSALEKYIGSIQNLEKFFRIMTFSNNRRQFDRVFYSVLGFIDGRLGFGVLDKDVLKYATDCEDLTELGKERCNLLISQINKITADDLPHGLLKANMRLMKFFFLTASLGLVDYGFDTTKKLVALDTINTNLSAFSSAKAEKVEKTFYGYSKEVIEEHRLLALISKGGHAFKRVENRVQILAYYINDFQNKAKPSGIIPV